MNNRMKQTLKTTFGFGRSWNKQEQITKNLCCPPPLGCGRTITAFRDKLSEKEYTISGLCQDCQDEVFRDDER